MRLGAFELDEPLPEFREPHALAMLRPWIDVGSVGSLTLSWLEEQCGAREVARIARPGSFYDFTRYRPVIYVSEGQRHVAVPNTHVTHGMQKRGNDFLFLHLLEPQAFAEAYVDSVVRLLARFGVKRYCLLGGMYDLVPHTRPLLLTGTSVGEKIDREVDKVGITTSDYEGPTTIAILISQRAAEMGIETMTLIVHLPQYAPLDEDYVGLVRLMKALSLLYDIPMDETAIAKADHQLGEINMAVDKDSQLRTLVQQLESRYDARVSRNEDEEMPRLSAEIEKFLREMGKRFGQS